MGNIYPDKLNDTSKTVDYRMRILAAAGICFVVLGHMNFASSSYQMTPPASFYQWFPFYSFHMPLFLFITGYFFRDFSDKKGFFLQFGRFILKKARNLLLPYYIINGIFLLIDTLIRGWGFSFGQTFSLSAWLLSPWTKTYIIVFSLPAWYLIALFITEVYYVLLRKLCSLVVRNHFVREIVLLLITLLLGLAAIYVKRSADISETATVYLRSLVMLFFIQLGLIYRRYLGKYDRLSNTRYFLILFAVQFLIIILSGNNALSPGLYALVSFESFGYNYFPVGITGIALWLRISTILASLPSRSRLLLFIGANTKYIMFFHVFGWFLLNAVFMGLHKLKVLPVFLNDFSVQTYKSYLYYVCNSKPRMTVLYFLAGMGFSLLTAWIIQLVKNRFRKQDNL